MMLDLFLRCDCTIWHLSAGHPHLLKKNLAKSSEDDFSILNEALSIFVHKKFFKKSVFIRFRHFFDTFFLLSDRQISLKCVLQLRIGGYTPKYHTSFFIIFYVGCNGNIFCMIFHDKIFMILHDFWTFPFLEL